MESYKFRYLFNIFAHSRHACLALFLQRGEGRREKGREGNIDVRQKHRSVASPMHLDRGPNP